MFTAFILYLTSFAVAGSAGLFASPELGSVVAQCKSISDTSRPGPHIWLMKQWHADPGIDTRDSVHAKDLPQAANQTAIYRQLDRWISNGLVKTVIAEGCAGELTRESKAKFNGWTVQDLEKGATKPGFDEVVTLVPLKLEAKYGTRLRTLCGDEDGMIRAHLRAFSDVRGTYGFLSRLIQHKADPERAKTYLEGVIELYKLPPTTTSEQAIERLKKELREAMSRLNVALERRNDQLMATIQRAGKEPVAVVYGGMHAAGLIKRLESAGVGCSVIEPAGYRNDEAALLEQLEAAISKL
jgi:hypothetical protein